MKTTLCTLYNSLYLDKGLVLYDSLKESAKDFELYVLCMDGKCFEVLSSMCEERLRPIHLEDVENDKMLEAKANRSIAEYCWTCSSRLIQFILETYKPECCTYIDADMYFYQDPQKLIDEMLEAGKSVMMVPHRFSERKKHLASKVGTYCVEFNCFKNDAEGLEVLNHWHNKCLECCSNLSDGIHWGDQKYMDEWPKLFPNSIYVCKNFGAGIATWNIDHYKLVKREGPIVHYKPDNSEGNIVFYHFAAIKNITHSIFKINIREGFDSIDYELVDYLYFIYLKKIKAARDILESKYHITIFQSKNKQAINYAKIIIILFLHTRIGVFVRKLSASFIQTFKHYPHLIKIE